ncbi:MAG: asparaginase [Alphaproteobacteria bacterium]
MNETPVLVEVTRGDMVESRHRGSVSVVDAKGREVLAVGNIAAPIYPRSAIKPLQALALVESGALEAFGLGDQEIALACASHSGESRHTELVSRWLARIGCSESDLECGPQTPSSETAARELWAKGLKPGPLHNNCSGKHAGFLTVARHTGAPLKGYIRRDHPVQQTVLAIVEEMCGASLSGAPRGIDGCGIPVVGLPLRAVALGMARLADPEGLGTPRAGAANRIRRAMAAHPFLVGGTKRFGTEVMEVTGERAILKGGAEGVYCGVLPGKGFGIALKIDDGAGRAAQVAMGRLLRRFQILTDIEAEGLAEALEPPVTNWAGLVVGTIRAAADAG